MIEIVKWSQCFESADTRKRQRLGWFLSPSGCDSKGFRKLMRDGKEGLAALGFFQALCQSLATMSISTRQSGTFQNSDGSMMEFEDILEVSRLGGMSPADYRQITGRLVASGWIVLHKSLDLEQNADSLPPICHLSPSFVQGEGEGQEEGAGEEDHLPQLDFAKSKPESPHRRATMEQVYQLGRGQMPPISDECCEKFFDRMTGDGWINKQGFPLADWRGRFREWAGAWATNSENPNRNNPRK